MSKDTIAIIVTLFFSIGGATVFIACYFDSFLRRFAQLLESHKEERKPASKNEADNENVKDENQKSN